MNDNPDQDSLDQELRRALHALDPGDDFTQAVMARVASPSVTSLRPARMPARVYSRVLPWAPAALAASLLVAIFVTHESQQQQDLAAGLRARQELLMALRVTSEKLDIAYQVVHTDADEDPGA